MVTATMTRLEKFSETRSIRMAAGLCLVRHFLSEPGNADRDSLPVQSTTHSTESRICAGQAVLCFI